MNNQKDTKNQPGWDAITAAFESVYPGQRNPRHYAPRLPLVAGGNDPLDGISVYDDGDCWHFVGYGLSDLYGKQGDDPDYSGFGVEYTLRLKKAGLGDAQSEERELRCVCALLQTLARLAYRGEIFQPFECLYTGQKEGIERALTQSENPTSPAASPCRIPECLAWIRRTAVWTLCCSSA